VAHHGVLRFHPEDEELDECPISWTIGHQNAYDVEFRVPITIYDLTGNVLYTHTEEEVPLGAGGWIWDGTIFEQEPEGPTEAAKGIYTYTLGVVGSPGYCGGVHCVCTGESGCNRGDWDKSAYLTITLEKFYWFEKDPVAGTLRGVVKYTLNRVRLGNDPLLRAGPGGVGGRGLPARGAARGGGNALQQRLRTRCGV